MSPEYQPAHYQPRSLLIKAHSHALPIPFLASIALTASSIQSNSTLCVFIYLACPCKKVTEHEVETASTERMRPCHWQNTRTFEYSEYSEEREGTVKKRDGESPL